MSLETFDFTCSLPTFQSSKHSVSIIIVEDGKHMASSTYGVEDERRVMELHQSIHAAIDAWRLAQSMKDDFMRIQLMQGIYACKVLDGYNINEERHRERGSR